MFFHESQMCCRNTCLEMSFAFLFVGCSKSPTGLRPVFKNFLGWNSCSSWVVQNWCFDFWQETSLFHTQHTAVMHILAIALGWKVEALFFKCVSWIGSLQVRIKGILFTDPASAPGYALISWSQCFRIIYIRI